MELLYAALACDITRIAAVSLQPINSGDRHPVNHPPLNINNSLHQLSHDDRTSSGTTLTNFERAKAYYIAAVGDFAKRLQDTPEAGGTMLDNTIIFIGTEISMGHTHRRMPFVTIGGKNLGVKTGQYMKVGGFRNEDEGTAAGELYVSFLQAMGLSDQTFGDPKFVKGPLSGYRG